MKQFVDENNYPLFDGLVGLKQNPMKTAMTELIELLELNTTNEPLPYLIDVIKEVYIEKEKEQNNQIIRDVFEYCWNHPNWNGDYDIKDMEDYLKTYNQNK